MSTEALICRVQSREIPGADRIKVGICAGVTVVISKGIPDGALGVYFPVDCALSAEHAHFNNLFRKGEGVNADPSQVGYLDANRRIRAMNLRGVKSEGLWMPLESLAWTGADLTQLQEGQVLTELNGKQLLTKYMTVSTHRAGGAGGKGGNVVGMKRKICPLFKEHVETHKLGYYSGTIPAGALIIITEKLHGTSGRTGNLPVEQPITGLRAKWNDLVWGAKRHLKRVGVELDALALCFKPEVEYQHITGTRRTVMNPNQPQRGYRQEIHESLALHPGKTLYYEIVGWEGPHGRPIMGSHGLNLNDPFDKIIHKRYGIDHLVYHYGCEPGTYQIYVYRITHTGPSGHVHDLAWDQVVARCKELGLRTVPELSRFIYDGRADSLIRSARDWLEDASVLTDKHFREGIVARIEHPEQWARVLKMHSHTFQYMEGKAKDAPDYVDAEESA